MLIVDEAYHLRTDLLEDLRLLTNYAMDSENRLTMTLVGHPELRRRMNMEELDALAQPSRDRRQLDEGVRVTLVPLSSAPHRLRRTVALSHRKGLASARDSA